MKQGSINLVTVCPDWGYVVMKQNSINLVIVCPYWGYVVMKQGSINLVMTDPCIVTYITHFCGDEMY